MIALQVFVVIIISITVGVTARSKKSNVNVNKHDWEAEYNAAAVHGDGACCVVDEVVDCPGVHENHSIRIIPAMIV